MRLVSLLGILFGLYLSNASASDVENKVGFGIAKSVENSDSVVRGTVTNLESVWCEREYDSNCTTEVIITVEDLIKGTPNEGDNKIKFMVEGGRCLDPDGEWLHSSVSYEPEFKIGEEVLVFLAEDSGRYCDNYPDNKLVVWHGSYGKRTITEQTEDLDWIYLVSETDVLVVKDISLPLDLSIDMCKAAVKDMKAMVELEEGIKDEIRDNPDSVVDVSETLLENLKRDVKAVLEKED